MSDGMEEDAVRRDLRSAVEALASGISPPGRDRAIDALRDGQRRQRRQRTVRTGGAAFGVAALVVLGAYLWRALVPLAKEQEPSATPAMGGGTIAFLSDRGAGASTGLAIFSLDMEGATVRRLTDEGVHSFAWASDGVKLAFETAVNEGQGVILVAWPDDRGRYFPRTAFPNRTSLGGLSWSPDGSRLGFSAAEGEIEVIGLEGRVLGTLTSPQGLCADSSPAWSPDGT